MGGLWRKDLIAERKIWAAKRNPKLDRKQGPLEVMQGITWRSVFKYNFLLMGLAGIIAFANDRAYQKVRAANKYVGSTHKNTKETRAMLEDGAEEEVHLTPREKTALMLERVKEQTNDFDTANITNVSIGRPREGLTLENLRETASVESKVSDANVQAQLEKLRKQASA